MTNTQLMIRLLSSCGDPPKDKMSAHSEPLIQMNQFHPHTIIIPYQNIFLKIRQSVINIDGYFLLL